MAALIARRVFAFMVPGSLLLLAGIWFGHSDALLHWRPLAAKTSLWLVPLLAFLLGWCFNRSKPVYLVLVLLLAERAVHFYSPLSGTDPGEVASIVQVTALLLPLNFVLLGLGAERGLFGLQSLPRLLLILVQPVLVILVVTRYPKALAMLRGDVLPFPLPWPGHLAQVGQLAFCLGLAYLLVRWLVTRGAMENGLFWGLLAAWQGLAFSSGLQLSLRFGVAGLILACAIVEAAHTMAFRDELTGLPSRRALNEYFLRLSGTFTVAMLDVDFFKKFNDNYGHDVGDQVLKMVAARIARAPGGGRAFRYGGEEFTIVFPRRSVAEVLPHLESVRRAVRDSGFTLRGAHRKSRNRKARRGKGGTDRRVGVTISIGVADRQQRRLTPEEVMKKADQALYAAKEAGRNRVVS